MVQCYGFWCWDLGAWEGIRGKRGSLVFKVLYQHLVYCTAAVKGDSDDDQTMFRLELRGPNVVHFPTSFLLENTVLRLGRYGYTFLGLVAAPLPKSVL